jgi:hypothetical protein
MCLETSLPIAKLQNFGTPSKTEMFLAWSIYCDILLIFGGFVARTREKAEVKEFARAIFEK